MKIDLITKEFNPHIYGGAGVHIDELSKVLASKVDLRIRAIGEGFIPHENFEMEVFGYSEDQNLANPSLKTLSADLKIANAIENSDLVHSHTWYANFAGLLTSQKNRIPHIITTHSLEPLRPWKAEQLGGGYEISKFIEKSAYDQAAGIIAVAKATKTDILSCYDIDPAKITVIHNGIDLDKYQVSKTADEQKKRREIALKFGINPELPTAVFVGRITRQKGFIHLLNAAKYMHPEIQLVFCAGAPDTKEIAAEANSGVEELRKTRQNVVMIEEMISEIDKIAILENSDAFLCPSVYEPFGIVNLEAMGLELPVVASAVGGIVEVVIPGETGFLVPLEQLTDGTGTPLDENGFAQDFAAATNKLFEDLPRAKAMGKAGFQRAEDFFSWESIGEKTVDFYEQVIASRN